MSRIAIYDGFGVPRRRRHHKRHRRGGAARQKSKMKSCAVKWRHVRKHGRKSYRAFMRTCLKK